MENTHPTFGDGKICYLEIPAVDIHASAEFYKNSFGWNVRERGDGSVGFDDGVGEVSGSWITEVKPSSQIGILIHIMVDNMEETIAKVEANGGVIVQPVGAHHPEITARFKDPAGNIMGLYQHKSSRG